MKKLFTYIGCLGVLGVAYVIGATVAVSRHAQAVETGKTALTRLSAKFTDQVQVLPVSSHLTFVVTSPILQDQVRDIEALVVPKCLSEIKTKLVARSKETSDSVVGFLHRTTEPAQTATDIRASMNFNKTLADTLVDACKKEM